MGTHPIFESDFDCLTEVGNVRSMNFKMGNVFNRAKMVLVVNTKSKLPRGQLALLGGQATIKSYSQSTQLERTKYFLNGQMKVTLKSDNLSKLHNDAQNSQLNCAIIIDEDGSDGAVLAIGPNSVHLIDSITGSLKLA